MRLARSTQAYLFPPDRFAKLSRNMLDLFKEVRDLSGQMNGIEKRLEDKDKLVEATVKLRIIEEVENLRAEFMTKPPSPPA